MRGGTRFRIEERVEGEGVVALALVGELDLSTKNALQRRLDEISARHACVRLDLSRLDFIDASGLDVLINGIAQARRRCRRLQIDHQPGPHLLRVLSAVGLELP